MNLKKATGSVIGASRLGVGEQFEASL